MNELDHLVDFPDDHWSRDWALLESVASDFAKLQENRGLSNRPQNSTLEENWSKIFGPDVDYPGLRRPFELFASCFRLRGSIAKYYYDPFHVRGSLRLRIKLEEIMPDILIRLTFITWRNAGKWLAYRHRDVHWARWWNPVYLPEEIRRTLYSFRELKNSGFTTSFDGDKFHEPMAQGIETIDEIVTLVLDLERIESITPENSKIFRSWIKRTSDGEPTSELRIARELNVSLDVMNSAIRVVTNQLAGFLNRTTKSTNNREK